MEHILHESNEFVIRLATEYLKNLENEAGLSVFTENPEKHLMDFGKQITTFMLAYAEEIIFKLKERKKTLVVLIQMKENF